MEAEDRGENLDREVKLDRKVLILAKVAYAPGGPAVTQALSREHL